MNELDTDGIQWSTPQLYTPSNEEQDLTPA